jgi:GntR family transcriptional repressor for pyruvate dehydrogenase complex
VKRAGLTDADWPAIPLRAGKLSEAVYGVLERLISSGRIAPGARLPAERVLAEQLGVSRSSVREAVHELELKRLVERRSGRGTIVLDTSRTTPHGNLLEELSTEKRDLLEIMDFRLAIEPPIAGLAAERATRGNLSRLTTILEQMSGERDATRTAELDHAFHSAIARATQNRLLMRLHDVSATWMRSSRREALQTKARRATSLEGHRRIQRAIASHDPEAAEAAMADHIQQVRRVIGAEA